MHFLCSCCSFRSILALDGYGCNQPTDSTHVVHKVVLDLNMSNGEEIAEKIKELGAIVASAKKEKKPIEEWQSTLDEMLALKVRGSSFRSTVYVSFYRNFLYAKHQYFLLPSLIIHPRVRHRQSTKRSLEMITDHRRRRKRQRVPSKTNRRLQRKIRLRMKQRPKPKQKRQQRKLVRELSANVSNAKRLTSSLGLVRTTLVMHLLSSRSPRVI